MPAPTHAVIATLRRAFVDICRGYSVGRMPGTGEVVYVKHLGHGEHLDFDLLQADFEAAAVKIGTLTEEQKVAQLKTRGLWSEDKELAIGRQKDAVTRFEEGRNLIGVPSLLRNHDAQTQREREALAKLLTERVVALGTTVERYGQQRLEDYYLVHNLFADKGLTTLMLRWDQFDDYSDDDVHALHDAYRAAIEPCSDANLRRLVVQDFFISCYNLCGDRASEFFGKPVTDLTYYQVRLANAARYFKHLLEHTDMAKVPLDGRNDPDAIERMHIVQRNTAVAKEEGKLPTGLSSTDVKEMGLEGQFTAAPDRELSGVALLKDFMDRQRKGQPRKP